MLNLKRCVGIAILLFCAICAEAQQSSNPVTLKELLNRVDENAPTLITDSAAINIRQNEAAETRSSWLPNLHLNYQADVGTNNNPAGPYFGFGIIPSNSRGVRAESNTSASLTNL